MRKLFLLALVLILFLPLLTTSCSAVAVIHTKQGDWHAEHEEPEKAIAEYTKAIELNPKAVSAYSGRGNVYFSQGHWGPAIEDFNTSIELDPDLGPNLNPELSEAYYHRGQDYNKSSQFDLAVYDLTKAIELQAESPNAQIYSERGKAYMELGKLDLARNDYNTVIDLDPKLLSGRELIDILSRCSSTVSSATMKIDITEDLMATGNDNRIDFILFLTGDGAIDVTNKKMKMSVAAELKFPIPIPIEKNIKGEAYFVDGWQYVHMNVVGGDSWLKREYSDEIWETNNLLSEQQEMLKKAIDLSILGAEKIDDVDCLVVLYKPDMTTFTGYYEYIYSQPSGPDLSNLDFSDAFKTFDIKMWITRDEYLPKKMTANVDLDATFPIAESNFSSHDLNLAGNIEMDIQFQDFNKPVVIELPAQALRARQMSSDFKYE